jgi:hypothetical protein
MGQAWCTCARIGVPGVDDQGAHSAASNQVFSADLHGGSAKAVAGEHTRHAGAFVQQKHREVFPVGFAHTRLRDADAHASDGFELSRVKGGQVHGHIGPSQKQGSTATARDIKENGPKPVS